MAVHREQQKTAYGKITIFNRTWPGLHPVSQVSASLSLVTETYITMPTDQYDIMSIMATLPPHSTVSAISSEFPETLHSVKMQSALAYLQFSHDTCIIWLLVSP